MDTVSTVLVITSVCALMVDIKERTALNLVSFTTIIQSMIMLGVFISPPSLLHIHILVTVEVAPTIIAPPISQSYRLGDLANITCAASGQPTPTFRWFFNDVELRGEIFPYLIIPSIEPENRGIYYCSVTNRVGSVESGGAQVTIEGTITVHLFVGLTSPWHQLFPCYRNT